MAQFFIHRSFERCNDLYIIYTCDKFICESFIWRDIRNLRKIYNTTTAIGFSLRYLS